MGKWNQRRHFPRRNSRNSRPDPHWSPPRDIYEDPEFGVWEDNVPLWEKKFCYLSGVPWEKILRIKKFIHCEKYVLDWDDLAGKEAFHQAKELYWAKLNGQPWEFQPPGPDLYIDKVDWNPYIDPNLIQGLDKEFFVPDEDDCSVTGEDLIHKPNLTSFCALADTEKKNDNGNPWERGNVQTSEAVEIKATGWGAWDSSRVDGARNPNNNDNPWESHFVRDCASMHCDSWGDPRTKTHYSRPQNHMDTVKVMNYNNNTWKQSGDRWAYDKHLGTGTNSTIYYNGSSSRWHHDFGKNRALHEKSGFWGQNRWDQYGSNSSMSLERHEEIVGGSRKREGSCQYGAGHKGPRLQYYDQTCRR